MSEISEWNVSAAGNSDAPPDGFPEGMDRSDYNDAARELMAAVRRWYADPEWLQLLDSYTVARTSSSQVTIYGIDATALFPVGRRAKLTGGGDVEDYVSASSYSAPDTIVTLTPTPVPVGTTAIYAYIGKGLRAGAFTDVGTAIGKLAAHTSNAPLGTAAYSDTGFAVGQVPLHSQLGPLKTWAYRDAPARTYTAANDGSNQAYSASAEIAIAGLDNITIPGTPDGAKKYKVSALVQIENADTSDGLGTLRVRVGAAGTIADAVVLLVSQLVPQLTGPSDDSVAFAICNLEITPAAATKLTLSFESDQDCTIHTGGTAGRFSYVEIQEIAT